MNKKSLPTLPLTFFLFRTQEATTLLSSSLRNDIASPPSLPHSHTHPCHSTLTSDNQTVIFPRPIKLNSPTGVCRGDEVYDKLCQPDGYGYLTIVYLITLSSLPISIIFVFLIFITKENHLKNANVGWG